MLNIYTAQIKPTVGDLEGNADLISKAYNAALSLKADLVVTPEMSLTAYPLEDLVVTPELTSDFLEDCFEAATALAARTNTETGLLFGFPYQDEEGLIYNAVAFAHSGKIQQLFFKKELPNYGVFDEQRHFKSGNAQPRVFQWKGHTLGVAICEDMWLPHVVQEVATQGGECIISPNGSPWDMYKYDLRQKTIWQRVKETGLPVLYVNQWGGQDELVFDGHSFALNPDQKAYQAHGWGDEFALLQFDAGRFQKAEAFPSDAPRIPWHIPQKSAANHAAALYFATITGLRDFLHKNNFQKAVLGLSGGVDSALVATMAADALGAHNVRAVLLPSGFSSDHSVTDAEDLAKRQGLVQHHLPIQQGVDVVREILAPHITVTGVTDENLQARMRGMLLMAFSNSKHEMLLSTGNKSEMAVGYATLYGDMSGGFNPLKDIYKTDVFRLCHWRNSEDAASYFGQSNVIPENIITKPPSAELAENQVDTNSLPPYDVLDPMLMRMIEGCQNAKSILRAQAGANPQDVHRIWGLFVRSEHKRRQACPGPRVTPLSLGTRDRRFPITNKWR